MPAPIIMAQIESIEGVTHATEIAHVDGIDVLFVGPADLQHDLAHRATAAPGDFAECLNLVVTAAKGAGKESGILARDLADVPNYLKQGFTQIAIDSDLAILRKNWQQTLSKISQL
jgi:2-dehydro-3-deoxyglucarate aldolase/4-hydroxy-2-oxoheptanedioate aldolase